MLGGVGVHATGDRDDRGPEKSDERLDDHDEPRVDCTPRESRPDVCRSPEVPGDDIIDAAFFVSARVPAMLLTITTTHSPATDLGYLLAKHPDRVQAFEQSFGARTSSIPKRSAERTTVALLLDVDPVALVRTRRGPAGEGGALEQYVNDRPYVGSSFLSVAIADVFRSALQGKSRERPELADTPIPLVARLPVLPCRGGEPFLRSLFAPLGYEVDAAPIPLAMPVARPVRRRA